ncbi:hypothetical protein [Escherichia coli]|uniref:glycine-rich domain-containing protein n=1 Tax=Escherichia coli TaxID=562 RepID=UPI00106C05A2|nr:hypothetical protein [Escherichia coli]EIH9536975.1 hypothetical protein [Escherichia coli]VFS88498.1 Tail fiber [Escherichia coli]
MALQLLAANNAQSVLAAGISASATSLTLNTGTGALFPSPVSGTSFFKLTLIDAATGSLTEIVHVTARAGDVFTIQRGQEGTVPRAWSANDIAANMMTAGTLSYILGNFQPLDPTLTALAALVGVANKLPYFNGDDTAALTDLTQVGRDIIGKTTIADVLTYLGLGIRGLSTFTASGSWTCPEGVTTVYIDACGGGGGGAYSSPGATGGGGGGGAAAVIGASISVTPGVTYTVTIGGPGAAGTSSSVNGVAGGATSFGSLLVLNGGGGGLSSAGAGVGGGTGGNAGTAGVLNGGVSFGGSGGGCVLGNGGAGGSGAMFGTIPGQYGGGGGGGANGGSGARGAYGILKLRW